MNGPNTSARIDLDEAYLSMAEIWAQRSKAARRKVGALIVRDTAIISDGYNGKPVGDPDDVCEIWQDGQLVTHPDVLHAESNAIVKLAKLGGRGALGSTLYVTLSPCHECAKLIHQAGIVRVVYREQYRITTGLDFLQRHDVTLVQR